ncbi:MAG: peptidase immune inhibitor, partial [Candidatus Eremiobacteraeota bacterium]|nr:peptidase immune inhibitor [Candidatus Eremiobacteraeota bacterium]
AEYNVAVSESAAGQKPSSLGNRFAAAIAALRGDGAASAPYRVRRDFRQTALNQMSRRTMSALRIIGASAQSAKRSTSSFPPSATHTFHVFQNTITGTGGTCVTPQIKIGTDCYIDVNATLQATSNHGYVWVDNLIDGTYNLSTADFQATATAFDTDYARETAAFGPAFFNPGSNFYAQCDANGVRNQNTNTYTAQVDYTGTDPHISILITKALENTGEGGYFSASDLLNDQELNCAYGNSAHMPSNQLPMFIMSADKYPSVANEPYWRAEDMPRTLPHEFQHYLHAINKVFAPNLRDANSTVVFDDSFVDEGDSMLAEDLVNSNNAQSNDTLLASFFYLYNPANYSFTAWVGYDADPLSTATNPAYGFYRSTEGNYGLGYLFARYMYDRFGGDAALHRVYASLTPTAGSGTAGGVPNVAPIVAEANNGETFAQLYADFAAALAARHVASTDPRFSFNSTVFLVGSKTVPVPNGTYDIMMNGPRSPDDLTSTHPSTRIKLTPGQAANAKLMTGATLFFNAAASAGSIVSLDTTTAPSGKVAGALVQGGYNDSGSCLGTVALNGC